MENKVKNIILILILITLIFSYYGGSKYLNTVNNIIVWLLISVITTGVVQVYLQRLTGNFFEKIPLTIHIGKFKFQVTLFIIITIILKILMF